MLTGNTKLDFETTNKKQTALTPRSCLSLEFRFNFLNVLYACTPQLLVFVVSDVAYFMFMLKCV